MILPALVLSLIAQTQEKAPDLSIPAGTSSELHHSIIDVENALAAKDFATAKAKSKIFPKSKVTYRLNTKNLNSSQIQEFSYTIETAAKAWQRATVKEVSFEKVDSPNADIVFSFEPKLSVLPDTKELAGATWFIATEPVSPNIEVVIGLKRGTKLEDTVAREVFNESQFTFGRYLGLAPNPIFGSAMGRVEGKMPFATEIAAPEVVAVRKIQKLTATLQKMAEDAQTVEVVQPSIHLEKETMEFDPQFQGDNGKAQIVVTNTGTAPLEVSARGDCGCINGTIDERIGPGKSAFLTGVFDTSELSGEVHHNLVLRTNDADRPVIIIPVSIKVNPRAEFVFTDSNTMFLDGANRKFAFYINSAEKNVFKVENATIVGAPLGVTVDPFDGEVSNYTKPGTKQQIHGYKVTVDGSKYPAEALFGRVMAQLYLKTDNPKIPLARGTFFLQRGIVSLPETLYLGSPQGITDATISILRPGRPFAIKKVSSTNKSLSFEVIKHPIVTGDYTIKVVYDGKMPGNRFRAEILVETDDPKQPTIRIPVQTNGA